MALKKAKPKESPAAAPVAAAEPVIETPVPADSGEAAQTPALQPDEPVFISESVVAEASITKAMLVSETSARIGELSTEAAVAESLAEAPAVEEEAEKPAFVLVVNLRKTSFRQPSSGLWIQGGEVKHLANDGWLENHVNANLLALAED